MLDVKIIGATLVDGTGAPARAADVGVSGDRITTIAEPGALEGDAAATTVDGDGLVLAPGFVDPHTHYDAQLHWDPYATPSNVHGVTSVIGGNCGFTLAPLQPDAADYTRRMMAKVEGMPLAALEQGVTWNWHTFGEFLDRLEGGIAVNAGFLVGHCAIRRYVMREASVGEKATDAQIDEMVALLHESIAAGGLGFSTTLSHTHSDGDGQPVPSRWASNEEVLALAVRSRDHDGTSIEAIVSGCLDMFSDDEIELLSKMSAAGHRPLNWNVLTIDSRVPQRVPRQLEAGTRSAELGGRVVALTMPTIVPMNMSFGTYCALFMIPGWGDVMSLPAPQRIEKLRDPAVRAELDAKANSPDAGVFRRLAAWGAYIIGDTYAPANEGLSMRRVSEIAAERGQNNFDCLLDIVINDDLRTILWPIASDGDDVVLGDAGRRVGRPARDARRFRRRRAPRPHVRRALHHPLLRRHAARTEARAARARRAADHRRSGSACSASSTEAAWRKAHSPISCCSTPTRSRARTRASWPTCPATPCGSPRDRSAWSTCS